MRSRQVAQRATTAIALYSGDMTEIQHYQVLREFDGFEVRLNSACWIADVQVQGTDFDSAGNLGFRPLVSYISGGNGAQQSIAMTAPVLVQKVSSDSSMASHTISFVLPANLSQAPAPSNARVTVRHVPQETVAVLRYSGRSNQTAYERKRDELLAILAKHNLKVVGPDRLARYDPPWTPWFLRRNEVQLPIADTRNSG